MFSVLFFIAMIGILLLLDTATDDVPQLNIEQRQFNQPTKEHEEMQFSIQQKVVLNEVKKADIPEHDTTERLLDLT